MKTLLVKYTPRNDRSRTKALLDAFRAGIRHSLIEEVDLCVDVPEFFTPEITAAYYERNMTGRPRPTEEHPALANMLRLTAQLKSADIVAVGFPMFNFSMPAVVKAWFDSVLHVGETIDPRGGTYRGMMAGKKALALVAAGGIYAEGDGIGPRFGPIWEHAVSLAQLEFRLMGYSDIRSVLAEGMAGGDQALAEANLRAAIAEAQSIAKAWFP